MTAARRGGKRVGYVRVSSVDQNNERQLDGIELDKRFEDKLSGKNTQRPQLQAALDYLRDGDTLIVHSMDRLARSLSDLWKTVSDLVKRGVMVKFLKESLTFTDEDDPMRKFQLQILGAVYELERSLIRERQREGIALAKKKGIYKGRKRALSTDKTIELRRRAKSEKKSVLAREYGISRETLYSYLRDEAQIEAHEEARLEAHEEARMEAHEEARAQAASGEDYTTAYREAYDEAFIERRDEAFIEHLDKETKLIPTKARQAKARKEEVAR